MEKFAVGLMSGTSLDGIDAVLVKLRGLGTNTRCEVIDFLTDNLADEVREKILQASDPRRSSVPLICSLNRELGVLFSHAVTKLLHKAHFKQRLNFIASHGQTIYHQPEALSPLIPSTLQIGDPSSMAYDHRTRVVFNFRMMDMVDGGSGAPLVPYTEYILYRSLEKNRLLQNIGGIGNITILPKNSPLEAVSAFDTGPGNMMINAATHYFYQKPFDRDGKYAQSGQLIPALFKTLTEHPYLKIAPPKSTGRELFGESVTLDLCASYAQQANDVIYTLTKFTAYTIAESYQRYILPYLAVDELIVGGGGAYNPVLMQELMNYLPNIRVSTQEDLGFSSDAKEAIAFALLGNDTLHHCPNNTPKATGAKHRLILGQIAPNPWGQE